MMDAVSRFNPEGYSDPTAYEAFSNIDRQERAAGRNPNYRPLCYICSPYRGNVEKNVQNARSYCRIAADRGYIPIAPHLLFPQFLDDSLQEERELGMFMGFVLLSKCRELWAFGDLISDGMEQEIRKAEARGIPVRRFKPSGEEAN